MHLNAQTARGLTAAACALVLLTGVALADESGPITLARFDQALARAKAENLPVVLDFYTDW